MSLVCRTLCFVCWNSQSARKVKPSRNIFLFRLHLKVWFTAVETLHCMFEEDWNKWTWIHREGSLNQKRRFFCQKAEHTKPQYDPVQAYRIFCCWYSGSFWSEKALNSLDRVAVLLSQWFCWNGHDFMKIKSLTYFIMCDTNRTSRSWLHELTCLWVLQNVGRINQQGWSRLKTSGSWLI